MIETGGVKPREWKFKGDSLADPSGLNSKIEILQKETGLSPVTLKVCLLRGLDSAEAIDRFLNPKLDQLPSPFSILDMDKAVARIVQAKSQSENIRVFGDYDVDGTTGASLLSWVFRDFGIQSDVRQPDRFKDGYGLNVKAVDEAAEAGIKLLITVDCGITSFDAAQRAKDRGIDLIVVDHHQVDPIKGLPVAFAIINPQRADCESGLKELCGCGLAFFLSMGLRAEGRNLGWFNTGEEPNLKRHLDLVVLATAADMVPLTGANHILVRHGLEVLKNTSKPGVKALLEAAGLSAREISPSHLGFVIGPRINASGRMQNASLALELLTSMDPSRSSKLAQELEQLNSERAVHQNLIWDEVKKVAEEGIRRGQFKNAVVLAHEDWHEGVVGIVASRVTETFHRPAIVIAIREGLGKGSVRSFAGKDVLSGLRACARFLVGFGGHKHAAGLSLLPSEIENFAFAFDEAMAQTVEDQNARPLLVDGECNVEDLDLQTLRQIEMLGPFGPGNPEPTFVCRATVRNQQVLKGRHLKLNLGNQTSGGPLIEAIWFNASETSIRHHEAIWLGVPELNRFRGRVTPVFRIRDWRQLPDIKII
jgi:single-stranded-DNA-specific exonuclease